jgi:dTMP kinase
VSDRWSYYGKGLPYLPQEEWPGWLVVMEGADGAGRTTQNGLLKEWIEQQGLPVLDTGLKRSTLVSKEITRAKAGNLLGRTTLSLLYTTDLADQLENQMIPALRAGYVVLADRYFFTMMARDLARGASRTWLEQLFGFALKPDLVIYLRTSPEERLHRALDKRQTLDFWESGMDLGLAADRYTSFLKYQALLQEHYDRMASQYGFATLDGSESPHKIHQHVRELVTRTLKGGGLVAAT